MSELDGVLAEIPFLAAAGEDDRRAFAELVLCRSYPRGNILFSHGDPADVVSIVISGRVKISLVSEEGREVVLAVLDRGGMLGVIAALDGGTQTGTATTLTDCRVARIPADKFVGWLQARPTIQHRLTVELAQRLREAYEKVGEQALLSVKERLRGVLLEIARSEGTADEDDEVVFVRPTHQELAERIGTTRVVVSRVLKALLEEESALRAEGRVIHVSARSLVYHDPAM